MKKIDFRNVKNLIVRRALQKRFSDFMFWYSDNYSKHKDNNAYSEWETPAGYRDGYGDTTHTDEKIHSDYSSYQDYSERPSHTDETSHGRKTCSHTDYTKHEDYKTSR